MGLIWVQGLGGEALRSRPRRPDFAHEQRLPPIEQKLRRAGCPRPPIRPGGVMECWSVANCVRLFCDFCAFLWLFEVLGAFKRQSLLEPLLELIQHHG
jgi:hypothetical protein